MPKASPAAPRRTLRLCRGPLLALAGLGMLAGPALAAAPSFQEAPGRVVFSVDGAAESQSIPSASIALPNGGVVVAGSSASGVYAAQLEPDGALDTSFGKGGIAKVAGLVGGPDEILRQADGKLILVGGGAGSTLRLPYMTLARLDADGTPDASFGTGGVEQLGIQNSGSVALLADGELVATGGAGSTGLVSALHPTQLGDDRWVVVELTATGGIDPAFGSSGIVTLPPAAGSGSDLAVLPDGDVVTTGLDEVTPSDVVEEVARLLPSGALDPTFNGGQPAIVPGTDDDGGLIANADGSVLLEVGGNGDSAGLVRFTGTGAIDTTFGTAGAVTLPSGGVQLLPEPGDGALAVIRKIGASGFQVERLTGSGAVDPTLGGPSGLHVEIPFGGATQLPFFDTVHPQPVVGLVENSFTGGLLPRPDGSYLSVGEVDVVERTGSGEGPTINDFAVAALSPSLTLDKSFGGPARGLRLRVKLPPQTASTDVHRHNIRVTLTASAQGDAQVVIRAAGRVVAETVLPVLSTAPTTLPVVLTTAGLARLRSHPSSRLSVSVEARDLLTNVATAAASGTLR